MSTNSPDSGILQIGIKQPKELVANYFYDELLKDGWKDSLSINGKQQVVYDKGQTQVTITVGVARKNENHSHITMTFLFE